MSVRACLSRASGCSGISWLRHACVALKKNKESPGGYVAALEQSQYEAHRQRNPGWSSSRRFLGFPTAALAKGGRFAPQILAIRGDLRSGPLRIPSEARREHVADRNDDITGTLAAAQCE